MLSDIMIMIHYCLHCLRFDQWDPFQMRLVLKNPRGFLSTSHLSDDTSQAPPGLLPQTQNQPFLKGRGRMVLMESDVRTQG